MQTFMAALMMNCNTVADHFHLQLLSVQDFNLSAAFQKAIVVAGWAQG